MYRKLLQSQEKFVLRSFSRFLEPINFVSVLSEDYFNIYLIINFLLYIDITSTCAIQRKHAQEQLIYSMIEAVVNINNELVI